jgi:hypothetical protein
MGAGACSFISLLVPDLIVSHCREISGVLNSVRKQLAFILFLGSISSSGCWIMFGERIDTSPAICQKALRDSSMIYGDKVDELNVDELLTLQKCGLAFHPQYQLAREVANRDEYPVPKILALLNTDTNQEYQLMLIEDLERLTESKLHRDQMRADEAVILNSVNRAISQMRSGAIKNYAQDKCETLEIFFWVDPNNQHGHENMQTEWLEYEPSVVELEGTLKIKTFFGPPNFGENPKTDSKEETRILVLDKPINVRAKGEADPVTDPSAENVRELQLVFDGPLKKLVGKKLIVKGTLFHAQTGHHFTKVLLNLDSIRLAPSD